MGTAMLRIGDNQVSGAIRRQVAQIVQGAGENLVSIRPMSAPGAIAPLEAAPPMDKLGFRQVFDTRDSFADVSRVLAWSSHPDYLPEDSVPPGDSSAQAPANLQLIPVTVLQCPF
jgi:hypothetical protein